MIVQADHRVRTRTIPAPDAAPRLRWLVIEPLGPPRPALPTGPEHLVVHGRIEHLSAALLARLAPDRILAPLIAPGWDILDLAARLDQLGWHGRLVARTVPLPRADLVLAEIRALHPGLDVTLQPIEVPRSREGLRGPVGLARKADQDSDLTS
jgi:hypothetical protein